MIDNEMHRGLRRKLVETVRKKGIHDMRVLEAIGTVPRHLFMDSSFLRFAYQDQAFPIESGQSISQPFTVAFQTELLNIQPHLKVLEVGTGSGYQAAILSVLGARVYTIERIRKLHQSAQITLSKLNYPVRFHYGDGYAGLPQFAPFDRILITAAIGEIPQTLLDQLTLGGLLVAPVGNRDTQMMKRIVRKGDKEFETTTHGAFTFVPMLPGKE